VNDVDSLREVEAIRQLKARYCRFLDAKDWGAWRKLFADDMVGDFTGSGGGKIAGGDDVTAYVQRILGNPSRVSVHHVHAPEIELTSATTARGIWPMEDVVRFAPGVTLHGYGHYRETYEKTDREWRIKSLALTRLRMDFVILFVPISIPLRFITK
jgi:hypothetical protein